MSFYTSLTGLNAATAQLGVTSNNIANVSTTGFKRSRSDFGDIFATSPLQKASATIGQGVSLKRVVQEFGQGNMIFSSNTLDLAISGDGFFPLKSQDGFQDIFTRNGVFMMNDQYNVVNSAGQRLMAASVDSSGKANLSDMNVLTIPQKTTGMATQTSKVQLGLNFPADAEVITKEFNRNNPESYNKSTALTVYDAGGNSYLATVYYVKTQNASQEKPTNKWQTYVYVGDNLVSASLQQATNSVGDPMYVNKYGELRAKGDFKTPEEIAELNSSFSKKTIKFSLDDLTDIRTSQPATVVGGVTSGLGTGANDGINFKTLDAAALSDLFKINVDDSLDPVTVSLAHLAGKDITLNGTQLAAELTNVINRAYGDEKPFDFTSSPSPTFTIALNQTGGTKLGPLNIDLSTFGNNQQFTGRYEELVTEVQRQIDGAANWKDATGKSLVTVSYDTQSQKLVFTPTQGGDKVTLDKFASVIGLTDSVVQGVNAQSASFSVSPLASTAPYRALNDQRYGIKVEYDGVKQTFVFKSGTTGDGSSIKVSGAVDDGTGNFIFSDLAQKSDKGLGLTAQSYSVAPSTVDATRGVASTKAVLTGNALAVNVDNNFSVDSTNNVFVVSVNGITGTVVVPPKDTYTLGTFMEALQNGINNLWGSAKDGLTPSSVNGVTVSYDKAKNALVFTSGTASTDSYIKVTGDARWGLDGLDAQFGKTSTWKNPTPFKDEKGSVIYIENDKETTSATGFDTLPAWSPIYFDKGELTFDTAGNLVSPKQGAQLDTVYLPNGKGALTINIDYSKSTQFASPYAVLSQSQDGAPEGDLVGLAVKDDGLVQASYSNGAQKSLAKIVLVNFSNPSGLRQIGDTNYYKTSDSGSPKYGEAGSAGFGTVRSGATERANVDLTQELVDLITEQRNFQANAKAMETSTSMTQTIIQIRN